jgi:hypothetical protein
MRTIPSVSAFALFGLFGLASGLAAQTTSPATPSVNGQETGVALTLTGCVNRDEPSDRFTLADLKNGTYQLTGTDMRAYVGKKVEVRGTSSKLRVRGGLYPSANVAAQAGAIDPATAAVAAMPGGPVHPTSAEPTAEFKVSRVRTVNGACK